MVPGGWLSPGEFGVGAGVPVPAVIWAESWLVGDFRILCHLIDSE